MDDNYVLTEAPRLERVAHLSVLYALEEPEVKERCASRGLSSASSRDMPDGYSRKSSRRLQEPSDPEPAITHHAR